MFFTENSTSLASNIPAAVGYSDGCGAVRALIEAEQNRHHQSFFKGLPLPTLHARNKSR